MLVISKPDIMAPACGPAPLSVPVPFLLPQAGFDSPSNILGMMMGLQLVEDILCQIAKTVIDVARHEYGLAGCWVVLVVFLVVLFFFFFSEQNFLPHATYTPPQKVHANCA